MRLFGLECFKEAILMIKFLTQSVVLVWYPLKNVNSSIALEEAHFERGMIRRVFSFLTDFYECF